ncbi:MULTISPECIES: hypothetical protein [Bifidobacterium]|uniref:hypothetical protein n=1 Tax=Bifidobacterium TaxID=1678 RepID=UPI0013D880B2|nr:MULTISPECIES: hypothetical protein [Bifidobacterium]
MLIAPFAGCAGNASTAPTTNHVTDTAAYGYETNRLTVMRGDGQRIWGELYVP